MNLTSIEGVTEALNKAIADIKPSDKEMTPLLREAYSAVVRMVEVQYRDYPAVMDAMQKIRTAYKLKPSKPKAEPPPPEPDSLNGG